MTGRYTRIRSVTLPVVLGAVALGFSACGGSSGDSTPIGATVGDFFLKVEPTSVRAGKVTFNVRNTSSADHEFVVLRTDTPADQLPSEGDHAAETGKVGEVEEFSGPNATRSLTLDLKPGKYVVICNVAGHYQRGMHAAFTIPEG